VLAVRVPGSRARAADDEQADAEDEDDELKGDAYGVLEAALQTLVADEELRRGEQAADHQEHAEPAGPWLPRTETPPRAGRMNQQGADRARETLNSSPGVVVGALNSSSGPSHVAQRSWIAAPMARRSASTTDAQGRVRKRPSAFCRSTI
jgi:hypothetical protein